MRRAIIARDEEECGSANALEGYNEGLHIFAVFLILTCGTVACSFATVVKAYPWLAISKHALFISRHFGTGVLISLAFVHLLPTAFENLWDDCLSYFWREGYDAMPGFIAMISALAIMLVEMIFTWKGFRHSHAAEALAPRVEGITPSNDHESPSRPKGARSITKISDRTGKEYNADLIDVGESSKATNAEEVALNPKSTVACATVEESQPNGLSEEQEQHRLILQCVLLELGILFHSVFIGLSISLSTGTTFIALMVAISFHQIFEGLALGARIANVESFRVSNPKPWLMSLAYGLTCPLGQAIGLGLRDTYNTEGQTSLLLVGIANAISAGMIMYAALVQLLGEELLSEKSYSIVTFRARLEAVAALIFGCLLMAMIAIWA